MVIRTADGRVVTIDGRERASAAMTPTSFWENGVPLPFNDARFSGMSVGVPGTVATWANALEEYGTISLADALQAGIRVARDGYVIDQIWFDQANSVRDWFDDVPRARSCSSIRTARSRTSAPSSQSGARRDVRADRAPRPEGLLPRRRRGCDREHGASSR
jgi:hypothetical protein